MKIIKGLAVFSVIVGLFGCLSPPEYSTTPHIDDIGAGDLYFVQAPSSGGLDSLFLTLHFKDGDGDLGLSADMSDKPFNANNYYLADGKGGLQTIATYTENIDVLFRNGQNNVVQTLKLSPIPIVPTGNKAKLVTNRTRKKAGYETLPTFPSGFGCDAYYYSFDSLIVFPHDTSILDKSIHISHTYRFADSTVYVVQDTLYFQRNDDANNIKVQFFIRQSNNEFQEFDFEKEYCLGFSSRFPVLSDKTSPVEGTLLYRMGSAGFRSIFGNNDIKIRVQIEDRALHKSNVVETPAFKLSAIKR